MENKVIDLSKFIIMVVLASVMGACSSDSDGDDGGESSFDAPKYVADAAKYVIEDDATSQYKSIELTESGNFIIQLNNQLEKTVKVGNGKKLASRMSFIMKPNAKSKAARSERIYSELAYGSYTKTGDNEYQLAGFGTLVVTKDENGGTYSLELTRTGAKTVTLKALKPEVYIQDGVMTSKLCRSWDIAGFRMFAKLNGKTLMDISANTVQELETKYIEWVKANVPDYDEDDLIFDEIDYLPTGVIFTKTGTYMPLYANNKDTFLAVSTWRWIDESKGLLRYSWNPDSFDDEYLGGEVKVEFNDGKLHITESEKETDEEGTYEQGLTYIFTEAK